MSQANRRSHPRQLRRVQVRVQRQGEDRVQHGFTRNLSLSGALISVPDPAPRGSRLRLELVGKEGGPVIYGEVVHAHRVPPELRRFAESAMGVRFLDTAALVAPFLPEGTSGTGGTWRPDARETGGATGGDAAAGASGAAGGEAAEAGAVPGEAAGEGSENRGGPAMAGAAAGPAEAHRGGGPDPDLSDATYSLVFERPSDLLASYRRDLVNGGLFVPTSRPVGLNQVVTVALHLPEPVRRSLVVRARVVQVVEPRLLAGGRTAGGVGLEILEADRLLASLRPLVARLEA